MGSPITGFIKLIKTLHSRFDASGKLIAREYLAAPEMVSDAKNGGRSGLGMAAKRAAKKAKNVARNRLALKRKGGAK